jgi:hypothetical protein
MSQYHIPPFLVVCIMLFTAVQVCAQPQYTVTDLGDFRATAIAGPWVVGRENDLPTRLNLDTGQKTFLQSSGYWGLASAVMPSGEAAGYDAVPRSNGLNQTAAYWTAAGERVLLSSLPSSQVSGINQSSAMSGIAMIDDPGLYPTRAMRWSPGGASVQVLGTLGGHRSWGSGIDDQGLVWGSAQTPTQATHAAVFDMNGAAIDLGTLDGKSSDIVAVNPEGTGVGSSGPWAMTATVAQGLTALSIPAGFEYCQGRSIAPAGAVVGSCVHIVGQADRDVYHAMLWPNSQQVIDLNTAVDTQGWVLESTGGISAEGEIVGTMLRQGQRRSYLLTPTAQVAAECGGSVPCRCGDTVVQDYTFTAHLGPCAAQGTDAGLVIASGVTVNGNGYRISGTRGGTGLLFDGVASSQVIGLHVTEFANGVKMRGGASGNVYRDAWVWSHTQHGVWLDQAGDNWIWEVHSVLNGASGIMLSDASRNTIGQSDVWSNPVSLHMTRADRNILYVNGLFGDAGHAAVLDDSHGNSFYWNTLICRNGSAIILHNSDDNSAIGNVIDCPVHRDEAVASR